VFVEVVVVVEVAGHWVDCEPPMALRILSIGVEVQKNAAHTCVASIPNAAISRRYRIVRRRSVSRAWIIVDSRRAARIVVSCGGAGWLIVDC
jgi:hypothetical protein